MTRRTLTTPWIGLGLLVGALLATPALAQDSPDRQLNVQAQATLEVVPDKATLSARLWERTPLLAVDATPDPAALGEARARLEERTGELIRTLEAAGLDGEMINAGSLQVRPDQVHSQHDGEREVRVRTQLERPIQLSLSDLEQVPTILDALTEAGVDALDGIQYDLVDRDAATDRALAQALERARHKAELMAETLGVELGGVLRVQETQAPVFMPRMMSARADMAESGGAPAEYRPGRIAIDAGVDVSWEIEP
ncbi:SIMPL domain-containing protein [Halomonas sp. H5]|uniref:SIMPL domain-containing protein n=1 Tax=Halomonas sp. H5 TaxID=3423910 RepID=UPI003D35A950